MEQAEHRDSWMTKVSRLPDRQIKKLGMAAALLLAACSSGPDTLTEAKRQVDQPYSVNGATYVSREEPGYDAVGIASWRISRIRFLMGEFRSRRRTDG